VSQNRTYDYLSNGNETWSSLSMLNGAVTALTEAFLAAKAGMVRPLSLPFYGGISHPTPLPATLTSLVVFSSSSRIARSATPSGRG